MANSRRWKPQDLARKASDAVQVLSKLDEQTIVDLVRRGEESAEIDGYGSGAGDGTGRSSDIYKSSTVTAALSGLPDKPYDDFGVKQRDDWQHRRRERDVIGEAIEDIFTRLVELSGHTATIEKLVHVVLHAGDKLKGRVSQLVQCQGCHRDVACTTADPIRGGYCHACDTAWSRWKEREDLTDPGAARRRFETQRTRFEGHHESACQLCADPIYRQRIAS